MKALREYTHTHTGDLNKGITLVALVVTIIILLILAGISISQLTGSGLFENTKLAEEKSKNAQEKEDEILTDYENKIGEYIDGSRNIVSLTTEEYNKLKNANNYSEEEVEIGNWIDGKTLYRKVIPLTIGSTKNQTVSHGVSNIEYIMIEKAILLDATGSYHDIASCSQYFCMCWAYKDGVGISKEAASYYTGVSAWIVINYTKTL